MPRRSATLELVLGPRARGQPAQRWVYQALRSAILEGRLRAGPASPPPGPGAPARPCPRHRGRRLRPARAEGYVRSVGSGTFVGKCLPTRCSGSAGHRGAHPILRARSTSGCRGSRGGSDRSPSSNHEGPGPSAPTCRRSSCSRPRSAQVTGRVLAGPRSGCCWGASRWGTGRSGPPSPRTCVRPVRRCEADQIAIVSGVQEALDLAARMLVDRATGCLEDPGYGGAARLRCRGCTPRPGAGGCRGTGPRSAEARRGPAGLHHAGPPVPARRDDERGAGGSPCCAGRGRAARCCSRTTTTASSATRVGPSRRCRGSSRTRQCCSPGASGRCSSRRCGSGTSCSPTRWWSGWRRCARPRCATRRSSTRRSSPRSSRRGISDATCGACERCTPSAGRCWSTLLPGSWGMRSRSRPWRRDCKRRVCSPPGCAPMRWCARRRRRTSRSPRSDGSGAVASGVRGCCSGSLRSRRTRSAGVEGLARVLDREARG
jgi:hypothetical protein